MVQSITIGGQSPEQVLDVRTYSRGGDELGAAEITVVDTQTNRQNISAGNPIEIQWSDYIWSGHVTAEETGADAETRTIQGIGKRLPLKHTTLHTVFYNRRSSEAVKTALTTQSKPLSLTEIHTADNMSNWTANAPVAERYAGARAGLYNWGTDLLFLGVRSGHTGTISATYHEVGSEAIVDGIYELTTRLLVHDRGGLWDVEIELTTPGGTTYVWEPELTTSGFTLLTLRAENAHSDGKVSETGTLQYRFSPSASVASNTGTFIDNAHSKPFERKDRPTDLSTAGVTSTDRKITRRVDESAAVFVDQQATEDQFSWWVDDTDVIHYEPGGNAPSDSSLEIDSGVTPVVDVDVQKDYESIVNVVTVQGDNVDVTVRDQGSIKFYGPTPRTKPIVDEEIKTEREARARGNGYLAEHAWDDARVSFTIADESFTSLEYGDEVPVTWPSQGLDGTYDVVETETTSVGAVTVTITASSGR